MESSGSSGSGITASVQGDSSSPRCLNAVWLGTRPYQATYQLQQELFDLRRADQIEDTVLLLEHEPTVTMGRGSKDQHLLAPPSRLAQLGVELVRTDRGGDVTLHGPGQLVAYPIISLAPDRRDVRRYVQTLTEVMRRLVSQHDIDAGSIPELIGLWADAQSPGQFPGADQCRTPVKLGAIGVRISRWITMHGFALNLTTDLGLFDLIVPCGISQYGVGSVARLTQKEPEVEPTARLAHNILAERLGRQPGSYRVYSEGALTAELVLG